MRFTNSNKFGALSHSFHTEENYNKSSYVFGRDSRFKYEKDVKHLESKAPGPGAYTSNSSFNISHPRKAGFGSSQKITSVVYHKELQNCYLSKHSPGPGAYNSKNYFEERIQGGKINPASASPEKNATRFKAPIKRNLLKLDDHNQFIQLAKKKGEVRIGTEARTYDPIFYSAQNKEFIAKGLR